MEIVQIVDGMKVRGVTNAFIGGEWYRPRRTYAEHSPVSRMPLVEVANCSPADVPLAVDWATTGLRNWGRLPPFERAKILSNWSEIIRASSEEVARVITLEMGKPLREARAEVQGSAQAVLWAAEEAKRIGGETIPSELPGRRLWTVRQPVGTVLGITPWNFPVSMVTRKAAPALAAGCSFILKPAENTPLSALVLAEMWKEAGGPGGVFQVLPTNDPGPLVDAVLKDRTVRKLTFTGSTETGRMLSEKAGRLLKKVSMELGGHAPFMVFADADLMAAARSLVAAKFSNGGQTCVSVNRVYVHEDVSTDFSDCLLELLRTLKVGDPFKTETDIGPLVNEQAVEKVNRQIEDATDKGARVLHGGTHDGLFFTPTLISGVEGNMKVLREETFGPLLPLTTFRSEREVLEAANGGPYGLAAYLWTSDISRAHRVSDALEFGLVGINDQRVFQPHLPFGGVKDSGFGREGGRWGVDSFLETKLVSLAIQENTELDEGGE